MSVIQAGMEVQAMLEAGTPEKLSIGAQGTLINMELSVIATEVREALCA